MLRRENELRISPETQKKYAESEKLSVNDWMGVTLELQRNLVREFGYVGDLKEEYGLQILRAAQTLYPNDPEIMNSVLYLKYNRARQGPLVAGEPAPDIPLATLDNDPVTLFHNPFVKSNPNKPENKPLVIIGASWS